MNRRFHFRWKLMVAVLIFFCVAVLVSFSEVRKQGLMHRYFKQEVMHEKYKLPVEEALRFSFKNKLDTTFALFINYHKHSGKKRLYVINLKKKVATDSFLVAHGCGDYQWGDDESRENPQFSNEHESHCSSLGKYRIGKRAYSDWGIHIKYFLHGLETSNSNAYQRTIVLHGWGDVADDEIYPYGTPEGWGCPAVSDNTMRTLDSFLTHAKRPVLLWAY